MPFTLSITDLCPDNLQNGVEKAALVALIAHQGQKDLDGNPVFLHPMTVALEGKTDDEKIVGFLHDVVEDTDYTFDDLRAVGFADHIIEALQLLTHEEGTPYDEYVQRIKDSGNELARNVKLNDLQHNLRRGRAGGYIRLVEKHEKALRLLLPEDELRALQMKEEAERKTAEILERFKKSEPQTDEDGTAY